MSSAVPQVPLPDVWAAVYSCRECPHVLGLARGYVLPDQWNSKELATPFLDLTRGGR
jgi:hypothetical protein